MDDETLAYLRVAVGRDFELTPEQSTRLRGEGLATLKDDARAMRRELQMPDLDEGRQSRDATGRFAGSGKLDLNAEIRRVAGR
jgi:hypothetical protein